MKILVIRFSSIGDIVLTTPVVRCLKKEFPESEIHFLTKRVYKSIVKENPYIDQFYYLRKSLSETITDLRRNEYDYIIDLHHNLRSTFVKRMLKGKSYSFHKLNIEKWLYVNFKINKLPMIHIVERYFDTVRHLGVRDDGEGLDFFIPGEDEIRKEDLPETHRNGYIAFVIGAKHKTKKLPTFKISAICEGLKQPIVLLGDKSEKRKGQMVEMGVGENVYNACDKYNLNQSASILKGADLVITHDTGLMHIAAALKKKIISIWGNTVPLFGMTPFYGYKHEEVQSRIVQKKGLKCRPCSKIGKHRCPKEHFNCMHMIADDKIVRLANELLTPDLRSV